MNRFAFYKVNLTGSISKVLKKMSGLKAGEGALYLMTYREEFHMSAAKDEVIVQLKKAMFPDGKMPDEVNATVEWEDSLS